MFGLEPKNPRGFLGGLLFLVLGLAVASGSGIDVLHFLPTAKPMSAIVLSSEGHMRRQSYVTVALGGPNGLEAQLPTLWYAPPVGTELTVLVGDVEEGDNVRLPGWQGLYQWITFGVGCILFGGWGVYAGLTRHPPGYIPQGRVMYE